MNLILGNLRGLKAAVLPETLVDASTWDAAIGAIGRGAALSMQRHCNRIFERVTEDTFEQSADRTFVSLPRFPVEQVTALDLKIDEAAGYSSLPLTTIVTLNKASGILELMVATGSWTDRLRVTYDGGFWADYTEDNSDPQPAGSTVVPGDLVHAWHLQVQHEIEAAKLLTGGAAAIESGAATGNTLAVTRESFLTARVKEMLQPFVRYS